jgi:putative transposase
MNGDNMEFPKRKRNRLEGYDYSQNGAYFVTICTHKRKCLFGCIGEDSISARVIDEAFVDTINAFQFISCPIYLIMPNHFHAILLIERANTEPAPTISKVIQAFKLRSTIEYIELVKSGLLQSYDSQIWQRSFHDHIIRSEKDFTQIFNYIDGNPYKWKEDCLFTEDEQSASSD